MQLKTFKASDLRKEINREFGSTAKLKRHLKSIAKYEYGCKTAEVEVYGCKILYTSNPNCFASFLVSIPLVGMSSQQGLDKASITKAGHQRGCSNYYLK